MDLYKRADVRNGLKVNRTFIWERDGLEERKKYAKRLTCAEKEILCGMSELMCRGQRTKVKGS